MKKEQPDNAYQKRHPYPCHCVEHTRPLGPKERQDAFTRLADRTPREAPLGIPPEMGPCHLWTGPCTARGVWQWYDAGLKKSIGIGIQRYAYLMEHGEKSLDVDLEEWERIHATLDEWTKPNPPRWYGVTSLCARMRCCNPDHIHVVDGTTRPS